MLVEIPDPDVILGIVLAFFGGLFALYVFYKIKPRVEKRESSDPSYSDRLEFYERQLIDMKIRLDSLDVGDLEPKNDFAAQLGTRFDHVPEKQYFVEEKHQPRRVQERERPNPEVFNTVDYVLGLITDKSMTSRDIQSASQRSREHTSRLMNKLFKEGYVERNTKTKPYTYSITDKGRAKIASAGMLQESVA